MESRVTAAQIITDAQFLRPDEGRAIWFLSNRMTIKATGASTGGAFGLVESLVAPGFSPPLHVHHREDESFWVVEGEVPARMLTLLTPGGGEGVFIEGGRPAEGDGLPPAGPPDIEKLKRVS